MVLSLNVLLTGLIVVFFVLVILTLIIKVYSSLCKKLRSPKNKKLKNTTEIENNENSINTIDDKIVAVITASVAAMCLNMGITSYKIENIKRVQKSRTAWGRAGIIENIFN